MLGQNLLRNFAHHGQASAQLVVALRLVKRLQRFALLNPHKLSRFSFHVPYLHVGKGLKRRSIPVLYPPSTRRYSSHTARGPSKKTNQAIGLAQREGLQNDCFRLPGRHELSARRRCAGRREKASPNRARGTKFLTIRRAVAQFFPSLSSRRWDVGARRGICRVRISTTSLAEMMAGDLPTEVAPNLILLWIMRDPGFC